MGWVAKGGVYVTVPELQSVNCWLVLEKHTYESLSGELPIWDVLSAAMTPGMENVGLKQSL